MTGSTVARVVAGAWAVAIVAGMVAAAVSATAAEALAAHGPRCPFLYALGVECPFCGMTRASVALGRGDLRLALSFHPLAPLVLAGILALLVIVAAGRADSLLHGRRPLALLVAIGAVWAVRLAVG